jgi:HPt (histidine-containing phosphotransfer) domain-containing protein
MLDDCPAALEFFMASSDPSQLLAGGSAAAGPAERLRPLDLAHLFRQTMGNRALEIEILDMFCKQLKSSMAGFAKAGAAERRRLAHALKGTGRSVGAFLLADIAEKIEQSPFDRSLVAKLNEIAVRTCDFAASVNR